ncbi:hypothetical protein KKI23_01795, partial [Patescibacteria group bacterium]|nr:hypothetical protein [Patescibacteria group bacterium]
MIRIGGGQIRELIVSAKKDGQPAQRPVKARVLDVAGVFLGVVHEAWDSRWVGALVVRRWEDMGIDASRQPVYYLIRRGVYTDLRRIWHIRRKQGLTPTRGEADQLSQISQQLHLLCSQLVGVNARAATVDALQKKAATPMGRIELQQAVAAGTITPQEAYDNNPY